MIDRPHNEFRFLSLYLQNRSRRKPIFVVPISVRSSRISRVGLYLTESRTDVLAYIWISDAARQSLQGLPLLRPLAFGRTSLQHLPPASPPAPPPPPVSLPYPILPRECQGCFRQDQRSSICLPSVLVLAWWQLLWAEIMMYTKCETNVKHYGVDISAFFISSLGKNIVLHYPCLQ